MNDVSVFHNGLFECGKIVEKINAFFLYNEVFSYFVLQNC
jgi:hypothetical protein